jgi:hypothetical protein
MKALQSSSFGSRTNVVGAASIATAIWPRPDRPARSRQASTEQQRRSCEAKRTGESPHESAATAYVDRGAAVELVGCSDFVSEIVYLRCQRVGRGVCAFFVCRRSQKSPGQPKKKAL